MKYLKIKNATPMLYKHSLIRFINYQGMVRYTIAEYVPEDTIPAEDFMSEEWFECPDNEYELYAPEGWYEVNHEYDFMMPISGEVTHFMPIPLLEEDQQ
jgi:hypothetical protein